jgi:hypothetical protein
MLTTRRLILILIALMLILLIFMPDPTTTPHCPTEDSCTIDYRNGSWHIEEVTP